MLFSCILAKLPILFMAANHYCNRGKTCSILSMNMTNLLINHTGCLALTCKKDFAVQFGECPNWRDITESLLDKPCYVCLVEKTPTICNYYCHDEDYCKSVVGSNCEAAPNCYINYLGEHECVCFGDFCNDIACQSSQGQDSFGDDRIEYSEFWLIGIRINGIFG